MGQAITDSHCHSEIKGCLQELKSHHGIKIPSQHPNAKGDIVEFLLFRDVSFRLNVTAVVAFYILKILYKMQPGFKFGKIWANQLKNQIIRAKLLGTIYATRLL